MKKRTFISVLLFNLTLILLCSTALASATVTINLPADKSFFIVGDTCNISATVTGDVPNSVSVYCPETSMAVTKGLTRDATITNLYKGSFTISSSQKYSAVQVGNDYVGFKRYKVDAVVGSSHYAGFRNYAVTYADSLTEYTNEAAITRSSFIKPYSANYNCLAFTCGNYSQWIDLTIDYSKFDQYLTKTGNYTQRPGSIIYSRSCAETEFPDAVYFSGYHFATVTSWDSSGKPAYMQSKWGGWEVIRTSGSNPFKLDYGSPVRWWVK